MKRYSVVIADPPWQYTDRMSKMKSTGLGASSKYQCMSLRGIKTFITDEGIALAPDAHLWLWATNAFLEEAHCVARLWGFKPKTVLTWVKGRLAVKAGEPVLVHHICQGHYLRNSTEHVVFAVRGKAPAAVKNLPTAFIYPGRWKGRLHSEKPPIVHEFADRLRPTGARVELFARRSRTGWDAVGDQVDLVRAS